MDGAQSEEGTAKTSNSTCIGYATQKPGHLKPVAEKQRLERSEKIGGRQFDAQARSQPTLTIKLPLMHRHVHRTTFSADERQRAMGLVVPKGRYRNTNIKR